MPVSPSEGDSDPRRSGGRVSEPWREATAGPEMRASPREESEAVPADETLEEPGYGHGV
jgi:hypothetical protein